MSIVKYIVPLISKTSGSLTNSNSVARELASTWNRFNLLKLSSSLSAFSIVNSRNLHTTTTRYESQLAKLRKKTGYAFSLCRKALELHEQDLAKAEKWLRAEAAKQGWEKAERVKSRTTGEGLIGIYTNPEKTQATMVELKCETDFVAKNEHFIELCTRLAQRLSTISQQFQSSDSNESQDTINKLWIVDENKLAEIAGSLVTDTINKVGENIRFVRGCIMMINNSSNDTTCLLPYTHAVAGKISSKDSQVILGKYGTIIAIQRNLNDDNAAVKDEETDASMYSKSIEEVGSRLGQHIIGLTPLTVAPPPIQTSETLKTDNVDEEAADYDDEPTALLKQKFIFNDEITVEQFLKNSNANVLDFMRFECGEEVINS